MLALEMILDRFQIGVEEVLARFGFQIRSEDLFCAGLRIQTVRPTSGEETRNKLGTIGRELEEGLIHQVYVEISVPDIDNEHHGRLQRGYISEVLLRTDTHVDASLPGPLQEIRNDVLEIEFVREKVI